LKNEIEENRAKEHLGRYVKKCVESRSRNKKKNQKKEAEEQVGRRILYYMRCEGNNSKHKIDEKGKRV
jgi:hypothetical protein